MSSKATLGSGVALVTGAASGIGKEVALAFAEAGVQAVIFADLNKSGAEATVEESTTFAKHPDYRAMAVEIDVTNEDSVQTVVENAMKEFGRLDYCVHSAGMGNVSGAPTDHVKVDIFDKTVLLNIKGTMLVIRAVSKAMSDQEPRTYLSPRHNTTRSLGRGVIVSLASVNAFVPGPGMMPYTTSKHAVIGITKTAALDNIRNQIRVNAVCPSWKDTPMMQSSLKRLPQLGVIIEKLSPLGRAATVEEVADYIVFLCSPSASYINGTSLMVDAGLTLTAHGAAGL